VALQQVVEEVGRAQDQLSEMRQDRLDDVVCVAAVDVNPVGQATDNVPALG